MNSDTTGRTNVKSRDIVSFSMSRGSLRVGGSFLDFACVGVNGGDVVVDADEHDFFGAVFSSDVEFAHVAGPAEGGLTPDASTFRGSGPKSKKSHTILASLSFVVARN